MNASPRPNPFPGLRPFRSDEHHLFFGREEQTAALLQLLRQKRFLAVVGTSGSGKSSLVRAGLIAELFSGTMTRAGSSWEVMVLRPGGNPLENLARAMVEAQLYDGEDPETLPRLRATLRRSRYGLVEAVKQSDVFDENTNLLVVVDQFEELFRFRQQGIDSEEAATAFVNLLLTASEQAERPIYVTITMRSDYLGDCSEIPGLAEAVNDGEYLIPRLQRDQKRAAIENPIGVGGARISPLLVQRLLNDVGDDPDQLPVLQHALMRMWEVWSDRGEPDTPLDFRDFEVTGGFSAALSNHADEIFAALPDDRHREVCERIFRTLTEKGADNRGIRRPTRLARLQAIAGADDATIRTILDAYRGAGVTFLMPGTDVPLEERTIVDLSHESLMRCWQRLRSWVEDEAQSARIFRRLADTAQLWRDGRAGLFRDPDLAIALTWREQQQPNEEWAEQYGGQFAAAVDFLEASNADVAAAAQAREAARQRELDHARDMAASQQARAEAETRLSHRLRWLLAGAAGIAVIALIASLVAVNSWRLANSSRRQAQELADKEAQTANQERQARADAESATQHAAQEKSQADAARKLAEASRKEAIAALAQAEESFAKARDAVNDYLTAVSDDERLQAPGMQGLRIQLLQSALQFYQQFLQERGDDPMLQRELGGVYLKVGHIYRDLRQSDAASQSYDLARRIYERLASATPDDPEIRFGLANARQNTGDAEGAIAILEKLIDPQNPQYQSELASAYNSASSQHKSNPQKRAEYLSKALEVRERLVRLLPDDADARLGLSGGLNNIAIALPEANQAAALDLIRRAVEHCEAAYRLRPGHVQTARYLKTQYGNLAHYSLESGDLETALTGLRRSMEVLERLLRDNQSLVGFEAELVDAYANLINELVDAKRLDEAGRIAERARVRIEEMNEDSLEFQLQAMRFHLAALTLARARSPADAAVRTALEAESAQAVLALRKAMLIVFIKGEKAQQDELGQVLSGKTEPRLVSLLKSLEQRPDMQELGGFMHDIGASIAIVSNAKSNAENKLVAWRQILVTVDRMTASFADTRLARRSRAACQQQLARAMLEAGRAAEARSLMNDALAVREQLVLDWPADSTLQVELAEARLAAGDHFTQAGNLVEAARLWEQALTTLEAGHKRDPNNLATQATLVRHQLHVAEQYGKIGQWQPALRLMRQAFAIQTPTDFKHWFYYGMLLLEAGETSELAALADRCATRLTTATGQDLLQLGRIFLLSPDALTRQPDIARRIADAIDATDRQWKDWVRGYVAIRFGQSREGMAFLANVYEPLQRLPVEALAWQQLGRRDEAVSALQRADQIFEQRLRRAITLDQLTVPDIWWSDWILFQHLRNVAHQAIHGRPAPDSPYAHLLAGRQLLALGQLERAEAELETGVTLRPQDGAVWLARGHIFSHVQRADRLQADLQQVQQIAGDQPRTWVEAGRLLTERGEHEQADAAFQRAAELSQGELDIFLDTGWWLVGPYPKQLEVSCPPEIDPDPSRSVPARDYWKGNLQWKAVERYPHTGNIALPPSIDGQAQMSSYALNFVYATQDRTAILHLWPRFDARVWLNGRRVFAGFPSGQAPGIIEIPVTLRRGRNVLLIRNQHDNTAFCECAFLDSPIRRGYDVVHQGLWAKAAEAFAVADQRDPLHAYPRRIWIQCLLATGREAEAQRVFAELLRHDDRPESQLASDDLARACLWPPERTDDRLRWSAAFAARVGESDLGAQIWVANLRYRAADFAAAEAAARKSFVEGQVHTYPLLILSLQQQGKADEARQLFTRMEELRTQQIRQTLASPAFHLPHYWDQELSFQLLRREAHRLLLGKDPSPSADELALEKRGAAWRKELDGTTDHYARLVSAHPDQARLWLDLARRYADLDRWSEVRQALDRAAQLQPRAPAQALQAARIFADHQRWDESAAEIVQALEWLGTRNSHWLSSAMEHYDVAVQLPELFDRVSQLRPQDRQLWIERTHFLARNGQWADALQAIDRVAQLDPNDHLTWHFYGTLAAELGDVSSLRRVHKELTQRFGSSPDPIVQQRMETTCLLLPGVCDAATIAGYTARLERITTPAEWEGITLALSLYRQGEWNRANDALGQKLALDIFGNVAVVALRSMVEQRRDNPAAAQKVLQLARTLHERLAAPGPGMPQTNWWNWAHSHVLVREAEALVPAATALASATPLTVTTADAEARTRQARATQLNSQAAVCQLYFHTGKKAEAASLLRDVLAAREELLSAEPENPGFLADLAQTRCELSTLLYGSGQLDDARSALKQSLSDWNKLDPTTPHSRRVRVALIASLIASAQHLTTPELRSEAIRLIKGAGQLLRQETPDQPAVNLSAVLAAGEYEVASLQASLGLIPEAAETVHVERWPASVDPWQRVRAAELLFFQGRPQSLQKVAAFARENLTGSSLPWTLAAAAVAQVASPDNIQNPGELVELARSALRDAAADDGRWMIYAWCAYRAGRFDETIKVADTPTFRQRRLAGPLLAMAYHRSGNAAAARQWLATSQQALNRYLRNRAIQPDFTEDKDWVPHMESRLLTQEAHELILGQPLPPDPCEPFVRVRGWLTLGDSARAQQELARLRESQLSDPTLVLAASRIRTQLGQPEQAEALDRRARDLASAFLERNPADDQTAELLLSFWPVTIAAESTVLTPSQVKSEGGANMTLQSDGSILVNGTNPDSDDYVFSAEFSGPLKSIRLEVMPDPSYGTCGRNGNFILSDFRLTANGSPVPIISVTADHSQHLPNDAHNTHLVTNAIDDDPSSGWAVFPETHKPHWAEFLPLSVVGGDGTNQLVIRLSFHNKHFPRHTIGRFRLSAKRGQPLDRLSAVYAAAESPGVRLALAQALHGELPRALKFLGQIAQARPTAEVWLALAVLHHQQADVDQVRQALARAVERVQAHDGSTVSRNLAYAVTAIVGSRRPEIEALAEIVSPVPADKQRVWEEKLQEASTRRERGNWYAEQGRWRDAIGDYQAAWKQEPTTMDGLYLAGLLSYAGTAEQYHEHSAAVLQQWEATQDELEAERALKICLILPASHLDPAKLARLAESTTGGDPNRSFYGWCLLCRALYDYRTGDFAGAVTRAQASREKGRLMAGNPPTLQALAYIVESLARRAQGDDTPARQALESAAVLLADSVPGWDGRDVWHDWQLAHVLYQEAQSAMNAPPASPKKPAP